MERWSIATISVIAPILAFLMFTGILGNILVIMVTSRRKTRLLPGGVFIRCLAVVDAGGSANIIFMLVTVCLQGRWIFGNIGCQISGTLIVFFGSFSLHLLCIISINRYLKIAKPNWYNRVFSKTGTRILLVLPWIVPLMMSVAPSLGWSAHDFHFGKGICHFYFSTSVSYTVTFLVAIVMIPLGVSGVCYSRMYCLVRKHTLAVRTSLSREGSSSQIEEIRSARIIFVLLVAFLMCYTPGSIINVLEMAGIHTPHLLDLISITLVVSKHAQNPLLYGLLNRRYRKELLKLLRPLTRHCCCEWMVCNNVDDESEDFTPTRKKSGGVTSSIPATTPSIKSSQNSWGVAKGEAVNKAIQQKNKHPQSIVTYQATDDRPINKTLQM